MKAKVLQLTRICLLPLTPLVLGGHLTGFVACRSTFFIFSSYSGLIEGSQIRTDLKQPPVPSYTIPVHLYLHRKDALSVALL